MSKTFKDLIAEENKGSKQSHSLSLRYDDNRLKTIELILERMKSLNKHFLEKYEMTANWDHINSGLIVHGHTVNLPNLVELKICEADKWEKSYFNPYSKKPITMCYNKFAEPEVFNQILDYNLVLYYDSKTNKNINWNDLQQTSIATVRAINISKMCHKTDQICYQKQLQKRVFSKERFIGKSLVNFDDVIRKGTNDMTPISQVRMNIGDDKNAKTVN